jgi:hypothetical protein
MTTRSFAIRRGLTNTVVSPGHNPIERGEIWSAAARAIADEDLVLQRCGLGRDGTDAA